MISLIFTFLMVAPFLIFQNNDSESQYLTFASALALSYAVLGFLGLIFVFLKLTFLPLYLILMVLFLIFLSRHSYRYKLNYLWVKSIEEIQFITKLENYKKTLKFFYLILILLFVVSIGPINHSDTANIYVGYPYKFWVQNSHFIDGNLNQGLMGIGDFANIFYFQEKTTWLIRTSQFIPLLILFFYFLKRKISNVFFLIFFTSPVFIQWLTIGKNNFLSESCLAVSFLVWERNKDKKYLPYIFSTMFIAIAFKISAIIISIPIVVYLLSYYRKSLILFRPKNFIEFINFPLLFSISALILIFSYRYFLINNPLYPLLSKIFNPGDQQLFDWEQTLRGWERGGFYPLWLFIPKSIGKISFVLGPSNLFLIIGAIIYFLRNQVFKNAILTVGISQLILLLMFSQGRADYYMSPLIIVSLGIPRFAIGDLKFWSKKKLNNYFYLKRLLVLTVFAQSIMFLISSLYSISLVLYVIYDYEAGMNKTAYNFYNSKIIEEYSKVPVFSEITGMTHLYTKIPFIANQKFERCFYYDKSIPINKKYQFCMKREGVQTIVLEKDKLKNNPYFSCKTQKLVRASRNIFLEEKLAADFCELK